MYIIDALTNEVETYKKKHNDYTPFDVVTKGIIVNVLLRHYDISEFKLVPKKSCPSKVCGYADVRPQNGPNYKIYFKISNKKVEFSDKDTDTINAYNRAMKGI